MKISIDTLRKPETSVRSHKPIFRTILFSSKTTNNNRQLLFFNDCLPYGEIFLTQRINFSVGRPLQINSYYNNFSAF